MSWQAKGIYRDLLDEYWAEGSLPLDHGELAEICGCNLEEFETYWPQIKGCWEETPDGLANATMDSMRTETDSKRVTNAKNGKAGAIAKLANAKQTPSERQPSASERHIEEKRREEKSKEVQVPLASTALAVPAARGKLVCTLPLNQGDHEVFEADVQGWTALYPAVDVRQELRSIKGWALSNPTRRKTKGGIARFVNAWLSRAQNEAKPGGGNGQRNHGKTAGNLDSLEQAERFARQQYSQSSDDPSGEAAGPGFGGDSPDLLDGSGKLLVGRH